MVTTQQGGPKEETARLGEEFYARLTKTMFGKQDRLKFAAIS